MILLTFSLFDTKTGSYGQPFFFHHVAAAKRAIADLLADPSTLPARYPADYQLHELAVFDDQNGMFIQGMQNHGSLVSMLRQPPAMPLFEKAPQRDPIEG